MAALEHKEIERARLISDGPFHHLPKMAGGTAWVLVWPVADPGGGRAGIRPVTDLGHTYSG